MLENQRNLEKAILQKQAMNAEGAGAAQNAAPQSQRSRAQPPNNYMDIENERYTRTDPMKSQLPRGLDLTPNMSNDAAVRQGYSQQRQGKGRPLLGENERAPLWGQALVNDQHNMRSVESEAAERAQGQGDNFARGSAQAVHMRGSQRTPRTPGSPEVTNDLIDKNDARPDGSRSPSHLEKRKLIADVPSRDLKALPHASDKLGPNQIQKSNGALRLGQVSLARGRDTRDHNDLLAAGLQGTTFKSQKKSY